MNAEQRRLFEEALAEDEANLDAFDRVDAQNHDASRFTDEDLNRQWLDERMEAADTRECRRAAALKPFVARADWLLDIHSMHESSPPLLLTGIQPRNLELARAMQSPEYIVVDAGHKDGVRMRDYGRFGQMDDALVTPAHCSSSAVFMATRPAAMWRRTSVCDSSRSQAPSVPRRWHSSCLAGVCLTRPVNGRWR